MAMMMTVGAAAAGGLFIAYKRKAACIEDVPRKMRRVVLVEANRDLKKAKLEVQEVDMPKPRSGEVLVKVAAAPVNPSDDGIWKVPPRQGYPLPLGNEGSGRVVASGGGLMASRLLGRNVAFTGQSYAEYVVVDAMKSAFTLTEDVSVEDGCAFFVNPFTVVGIVDTVRSNGGKVFIHTAAASQLGQMLVKFCKQEGITLVNLVRRKEQADLLRKLGADHIVDSSTENWKSDLKTLINDLKIKHAFDCIAGDMPGTLLTMLPPGSSVWVYGRLSDQPVGGIEPLDLIYRGKKLQGFLLTSWIFKGGMISALRRSIRTGDIVRKYLGSVFASDFKDTSLLDLHRDYTALQASGVTGAKMRLRPNSAS